MSSRWPLQEASPCLSVVMSHCWTISLASTSRPPSTSLVWPSREFLCKPDPPSSAPRPSPSSRHLLFAHQPSRVKMMGQFKKKRLCFLSFSTYILWPVLHIWHSCRSSNLQQAICLPSENGKLSTLSPSEPVLPVSSHPAQHAGTGRIL